MSQPNSIAKYVLMFGGGVTTLCILGAIALSFAPGDNKEAIDTLLATALPAGISAAAGAFQSGGSQREDNSTTVVESDSYTLSQGRLTPDSREQSQRVLPYLEPDVHIEEDWVDESYRD
jgi:hypothetical protein